MQKMLAVEDKLATNEELDLSNDQQSCELFWAATLDYVRKEGASELRFHPDDGNKCLTVVIENETYEMVPLPLEVRPSYLQFGQKLALGWFSYAYLARWSKKPFARERRDPILIEVGNRRSNWKIQCTQDSVRFVCVD